MGECTLHRRSSASAYSHVRLCVACAATYAIGSDYVLIIIIKIRDVQHLKERLLEEWGRFDQGIVDQAVKQWRQRLRACVREGGGHFEHMI